MFLINVMKKTCNSTLYELSNYLKVEGFYNLGGFNACYKRKKSKQKKQTLNIDVFKKLIHNSYKIYVM